MKWVLVWLLAGNPTPVIPYLAHSEAKCKEVGAALAANNTRNKGAWMCARVLEDVEVEPMFMWQPPLTPVVLR